MYRFAQGWCNPSWWDPMEPNSVFPPGKSTSITVSNSGAYLTGLSSAFRVLCSGSGTMSMNCMFASSTSSFCLHTCIYTVFSCMSVPLSFLWHRCLCPCTWPSQTHTASSAPSCPNWWPPHVRVPIRLHIWEYLSYELDPVPDCGCIFQSRDCTWQPAKHVLELDFHGCIVDCLVFTNLGHRDVISCDIGWVWASFIILFGGFN